MGTSGPQTTPRSRSLPPGARGKVLPESERQRCRPKPFGPLPRGRARRGTGRAPVATATAPARQSGEPRGDRAPRATSETRYATRLRCVPPRRTHGPLQRALDTWRCRGRRPRTGGRTGPAAPFPEPDSRQARRHGTGSGSGVDGEGRRNGRRLPGPGESSTPAGGRQGEAREGTEEAGGRYAARDCRGARELGGRAPQGSAPHGRPSDADARRATGTDRTGPGGGDRETDRRTGEACAANGGPQRRARGAATATTAGEAAEAGPPEQRRQDRPGESERRGREKTDRRTERRRRAEREAEKSAPAAAPGPGHHARPSGAGGGGRRTTKRRRCARGGVAEPVRGGASPLPKPEAGSHQGRKARKRPREKSLARRTRPNATPPDGRDSAANATRRRRGRANPPRTEPRGEGWPVQSTGEQDTLQRGGATQRPSSCLCNAKGPRRPRTRCARGGGGSRPGHRKPEALGHDRATGKTRAGIPPPSHKGGPANHARDAGRPVSREPAPQRPPGRRAHAPAARTHSANPTTAGETPAAPAARPRRHGPPARARRRGGGREAGRGTLSLLSSRGSLCALRPSPNRDRPPETPFRVPTAPHGRAPAVGSGGGRPTARPRGQHRA